jgi:hypothetical protein
LSGRCNQGALYTEYRGPPHDPLGARAPPRKEATEGHANPALLKRRNPMVEHPVETIKHWHDQGYVVMKGREQVRAECSLSTLADNRRRVLTILGGSHLLRALA